eukprot:scaffold25445_cov183-Amphora_coffeaeformis.AAC.4
MASVTKNTDEKTIRRMAISAVASIVIVIPMLEPEVGVYMVLYRLAVNMGSMLLFGRRNNEIRRTRERSDVQFGCQKEEEKVSLAITVCQSTAPWLATHTYPYPTVLVADIGGLIPTVYFALVVCLLAVYVSTPQNSAMKHVIRNSSIYVVYYHLWYSIHSHKKLTHQ